RMDCRRAREKWPSACGMLLLLLWGTVAIALPLEGGPTGLDSTHDVAEVKRNSLLTFLAWWHEWTSQASAGALIRGDGSEVSKRQEGRPLQKPPRQDKAPCKNFFWKTFSSCK
uniref:Cortistatin n=1 Tax=Nannospalax galili TaxID=1026970 RepID=A0A8C6QNT8_NANGA